MAIKSGACMIIHHIRQIKSIDRKLEALNADSKVLQ